MIDETAGAAGGSNAAPENEPTQPSERVAFCQQCGRPLTADTVRRAGAAVYCEPCLVARLENSNTTASGPAYGPRPTPSGYAAGPAAAPGWTPVNSTTPPGPYGQPPSGPVPPNEPSPWLAAFLGLIPGVGAMYNGQYAKGIAHLVIFAVLSSLSDNVNGVFGLLVAGWVFYQAFDAYHTAKARRDGTPLPNPFGLNDIGDRMGFGRNWPGSAARPATSSTTAGWATAATPPGSTPPPHQPPNWSGYVPPTNFGANAPPSPSAYTTPPSSSGSSSVPPSGSAWTQPPYAPTYAPDPWGNPSATPNPAPWGTAPVPPPMPPLPVRRFPMGAAWLIAIGLIFLFANLNGSWRLNGSWTTALVLAALGAFILFRRIEMVRAWDKLHPDSDAHHDLAPRLACQVRWPAMLLVLALLFVLQAAGIRTLGQTWGILLIAFGALLVLERTVGRSSWYPTPGYPANPGYPASSSAAAPSPSAASEPARKDGQ